MPPLVSLTCVSLARPHTCQAALKDNSKASWSQLSQQVMAPGKRFWIQMSSVTKAWKIPPWYITSVCASGWFLVSVYYFCFRSSCFPEFDRYNTGITISSANSTLDMRMQYCSLLAGFLLFMMVIFSLEEEGWQFQWLVIIHCCLGFFLNQMKPGGSDTALSYF